MRRMIFSLDLIAVGFALVWPTISGAEPRLERTQHFESGGTDLYAYPVARQ